MSTRVYTAPIRPEDQRARLIHGRHMMCPRCKRDHDVLGYRPMGEIEEHKTETVPIYKCPSCTWLFAPVGFDIREMVTGVNVSVRDAS